jgi:hypothetical protein
MHPRSIPLAAVLQALCIAAAAQTYEPTGAPAVDLATRADLAAATNALATVAAATYLPIAGGTATGPIWLPSDVVVATNAAVDGAMTTDSAYQMMYPENSVMVPEGNGRWRSHVYALGSYPSTLELELSIFRGDDTNWIHWAFCSNQITVTPVAAPWPLEPDRWYAVGFGYEPGLTRWWSGPQSLSPQGTYEDSLYSADFSTIWTGTLPVQTNDTSQAASVLNISQHNVSEDAGTHPTFARVATLADYVLATSLPGPGCTDISATGVITGTTVNYLFVSATNYVLSVASGAPRYNYHVRVISTNAVTFASGIELFGSYAPEATNSIVIGSYTGTLWQAQGGPVQ